MKGTLHKTEQGWVVRYMKEGSMSWHKGIPLGLQFEKAELPLHPKDLYVIDHTGYILGEKQEFEFEIVKEYIDSHTNQVQKYAKLINVYKLGNDDQVSDVRKMVEDDVKTTTSDLIDSAIWSLPFEERMKCWDLIEKLVEEEKETLYTEEQVKLAYMQGYNRGKDGNPNHMESYIEFLKQSK